MMLDRRTFLSSSSLLLISGCMVRPAKGGENTSKPPILNAPEISEIEKRIGGRLGVALVDGDGALMMSHRSGERFAMCSTFKAALASMLFAAHEADTVDMFAKFELKASDSVPYMPFVEKKLAAREMVSLHELAGATVMTSDNAAANLILKAVGGPQAFTSFVRANGDNLTRLDRMEPELNENAPGDPRDTTTPEAMARLLRKLAIEDVASDPGKLSLQKWMKNSKTGGSRIRAGLPEGWLAGNKTGTADRGIARNDIAIIWPVQGDEVDKPVVLTVYVDRPTVHGKQVDAAIADVARVIVPLIAPVG